MIVQRRIQAVRRTVAIGVIGATTACPHRAIPDAIASGPCGTVSQEPPAIMVLSQLPGDYRVTFVATAGGRSGHSASGSLTMRVQELERISVKNLDTNTVVTEPAIGRLDLALDSIGATRMGDPLSQDPAMPGVGVYVTGQRNGEVTGVVARVGSASNAGGKLAFDGGYFVLYIRRITAEGVWGGWASSPGSSGLVSQEASGHFCALK